MLPKRYSNKMEYTTGQTNQIYEIENLKKKKPTGSTEGFSRKYSRLGRMTSREGQFGDAGLVQFTEAFGNHLIVLGFGCVVDRK